MHSGIQWGIIIGVIIIIVWFLFSLLSYKNSSDRLGNMILKKYSLFNKVPEGQYANFKNVHNDGENVTADIILTDDTQKIISTKKVTYILSKNCSLLDSSCISY